MKIPLYGKVIGFIALFALLGSGDCESGGSSSNLNHGTTVNFSLKYVNQSGAEAVFSSTSNQTQHVAAGASSTVPASALIATGAQSANFTVAVTGGGGEHQSGTTQITQADAGKTITATWPPAENAVVITH